MPYAFHLTPRILGARTVPKSSSDSCTIFQSSDHSRHLRQRRFADGEQRSTEKHLTRKLLSRQVARSCGNLSTGSGLCMRLLGPGARETLGRVLFLCLFPPQEMCGLSRSVSCPPVRPACSVCSSRVPTVHTDSRGLVSQLSPSLAALLCLISDPTGVYYSRYFEQGYLSHFLCCRYIRNVK